MHIIVLGIHYDILWIRVLSINDRIASSDRAAKGITNTNPLFQQTPFPQNKSPLNHPHTRPARYITQAIAHYYLLCRVLSLHC